MQEDHYLQDDGKKGRKFRTLVKDLGGLPYLEILYGWSSVKIDGIHRVTLDFETEYTFDGVPSNPRGRETRYFYDEHGNIEHIKYMGDLDFSGDEKDEYIDYVKNPTKWIVDKPETINLFNASGRKVAETLYLYDGHGLTIPPTKGDLTTKVEWLDTGMSPETNYGYDSYGNLETVTDAEWGLTRYEYDLATYTFPERVYNPLNQLTTYQYDPGTGNLLSETDPNDFKTEYKYDSFGRIIKQIKEGDSEAQPTVSYSYDLNGVAPERVLISVKESPGSTFDSYTFVDGFSRVVQTKMEAEDAGEQVAVNVYYDSLGRVESQSIPHHVSETGAYSPPNPSVKETSYAYDPVGRIVSKTNVDGSTRSWDFDHWTVAQTDEENHRREQLFDAYGRVGYVKEYNGLDVYTTSYDYDGFDNIVSITDHEGNDFGFVYDSLSRRIELNDPYLGSWTYEYDLVGNLKTQTDARGDTITFNYDGLDRVTSIEYNTSDPLTFEYDTSKIGTLYRVNDSVGASTTYSYDSRLRKTSETVSADGRSWTKSYGYDSMDRVTDVTYPGPSDVDYSYNSQGLLEYIGGLVGFDYNAQGRVTSKAFNNGVVTNLEYHTDDDLRLKSISTSGKQDLSYTYDDVGNIVSITDAFAGFTQNFDYDDLDRLIEASEVDGSLFNYQFNSIGNIVEVSEGDKIVSYAYAEGGTSPHAVTRISKLDCSGSPPPDSGDWTIASNTVCSSSDIRLSEGSDILVSSGDLTMSDGSLTLDGAIELSTGQVIHLDNTGTEFGQSVYEYDENGNMVSDGSFGFVYNDANQLYEVREGGVSGNLIARYYYNSDGMRFKKVTYDGGDVAETVYYIGRDYETKVNDSGEYNTIYFYANNELVARRDEDGSVHYYHNDHWGGTNVVTNQAGVVEEQTKYTPYGAVISGGVSNKLYTGQTKDKETGLMYYGARYYNPEFRRFTQPDPIIKDIYDPQNLNRYSYTLNNPLKYNDPNGQSAELIFLAGYAYGSVEGYLLYKQECKLNNVPFNEDKARQRSILQGAYRGGGFVFLRYLKNHPTINYKDLIKGYGLLEVSRYVNSVSKSDKPIGKSELVYNSAEIFLDKAGYALLSDKFINLGYENLPPDVRVALMTNPEFLGIVEEYVDSGTQEMSQETIERIREMAEKEYEKRKKEGENSPS